MRQYRYCDGTVSWLRSSSIADSLCSSVPTEELYVGVPPHTITQVVAAVTSYKSGAAIASGVMVVFGSSAADPRV